MPRYDPRQLNRAAMYTQGLIRQPTSRGLFGPNIQQGGVGLGPGRNTLIAGPGAAAAKAMGSAINRYKAPGVPLLTSPRVMNTGGAKVSDIFKGARLGQLGSRVGEAAPAPYHGQLGQFAQQPPGIPAQGAGLRLGKPDWANVDQMPIPVMGREINMPSVTLQEPSNVGDGPQGFMDKVGGFFKKPGVGESMMAAGAAMMSGRDAQGNPYTDPLQSVGAGVQAGLGKYGELKGSRRIEEDRKIQAEQRKLDAEDRARRIIAEDLATTREVARREAYAQIMPVDPVTDERGEFDDDAWHDAMAVAMEQGNFDFAMVLQQMKPEDEATPVADWKPMAQTQEMPDGTHRTVFYRTNPTTGAIEFKNGENTVAPSVSARGGLGGVPDKDEQTGNAAIEAIGHLVDTGGWLALTGQARDNDVFYRKRKELYDLRNEAGLPEPTATELMEYTRDAWSDAEGFLPEGVVWWQPSTWGEGETPMGTELSMLLMSVLNDTSGTAGEGDWLLTKALKSMGAKWAQKNEGAVRFAQAQAFALQAINPMVRYLSGAQMTNAEAMRYYGALIPTWGDSQTVANAKMRGLMIMAQAMRGDSEARELVDMRGFVDDDRLTVADNLEARNEWAQAQATQLFQSQLVAAQGEEYEREAAKREEWEGEFDEDGNRIVPEHVGATRAELAGAARLIGQFGPGTSTIDAGAAGAWSGFDFGPPTPPPGVPISLSPQVRPPFGLGSR